MESIKLCRLDTPIIFIEARINLSRVVVFFFFQAEDGIRDYKVTGVQTCALPIYGLLQLPPGLPVQPGAEQRAGPVQGGYRKQAGRAEPAEATGRGVERAQRRR